MSRHMGAHQLLNTVQVHSRSHLHLIEPAHILFKSRIHAVHFVEHSANLCADGLDFLGSGLVSRVQSGARLHSRFLVLYHPRTASSSFGSIVRMSRPDIGSPRSVDTSAILRGSS